MNAVAETLKAAREKVAIGWTQHALARNQNGYILFSPSSEAAVCWCASGAIEAASPDGWWSAKTAFLAATGAETIPYWNDKPGRTQAEVLAAFDEAIRRAEAA